MDDLPPTPLRQDLQQRRLRIAYSALGGAYPRPLENVEYWAAKNAATLGDAEHVVRFWERLAGAVETVRAEAPNVDGKRVVDILCLYTFGLLPSWELADPTVKMVVQLANGLFTGPQRKMILGD